MREPTEDQGPEIQQQSHNPDTESPDVDVDDDMTDPPEQTRVPDFRNQGARYGTFGVYTDGSLQRRRLVRILDHLCEDPCICRHAIDSFRSPYRGNALSGIRRQC